jgi:hypothetical protein
MTLATIQAVGSIIDAHIMAANPTTNYGGNNTLTIGYNSGISRILMEFDTSTIPSSSTVNAATVVLYCSNNSISATAVLYQCLRPWVEGSATWNKYDGSNNWTTAGAGSDGNDYNSTNLGSSAITSTGYKNFPMTASGVALVNGWVSTGSANYGLIIRHTSETTNLNLISSSENAAGTQIPSLIIDYTDSGSASAGYTLILNT